MHTSDHARPVCGVCGEMLADGLCQCATCQTPSHAECFAYAGGCAVFGCGSRRAVFSGAAPSGWRLEGKETGAGLTWLVPVDVRSAPTAFIPKGVMGQCLRYWRTCSQLELFSLLGQTWLAGISCVAVALGLWEAPALLGVTAALVLLAHLNALVSLTRLWWLMTAGNAAEESSPEEDVRTAANRRRADIDRSVGLLMTAAVVLVPSIVLSVGLARFYPVLITACAVVFPWFSLVPRWRIERALLVALPPLPPRDAGAHAGAPALPEA